VSSVVQFAAPAAAVRAEIDFLRPMAGRPYSYGYEPAGHDPPPTAVFETHRVVILNARSAPRRLSLDEHGAVRSGTGATCRISTTTRSSSTATTARRQP
jgi:hypothetical protein